MFFTLYILQQKTAPGIIARGRLLLFQELLVRQPLCFSMVPVDPYRVLTGLSQDVYKRQNQQGRVA